MGPFGPDASRAAPNESGLCQQFPRTDLDFSLKNGSVAVLSVKRVIDPAVIIEEQRWVHREDIFRDPNWLRPRPGGVRCRHVEATVSGYVGGDHVEDAIVMTDRRREDALRAP